MPTPEQITATLATMARELAWLAVAWHVVAVAVVIALVRGWRPQMRDARILVGAPIASVALASIAYGNAFNAISFGVLAVVLAVVGIGAGASSVARRSAWSVLIGCALIAFGLAYPHFVEGAWPWRIAAAPVGVVPCPTLAVVAGIAIAAGGFGSRTLRLVLALWVAFYAWFGVARLGVTLDLGLGLAVFGLVANL